MNSKLLVRLSLPTNSAISDPQQMEDQQNLLQFLFRFRRSRGTSYVEMVISDGTLKIEAEYDPNSVDEDGLIKAISKFPISELTLNDNTTNPKAPEESQAEDEPQAPAESKEGEKPAEAPAEPKVGGDLAEAPASSEAGEKPAEVPAESKVAGNPAEAPASSKVGEESAEAPAEPKVGGDPAKTPERPKAGGESDNPTVKMLDRCAEKANSFEEFVQKVAEWIGFRENGSIVKQGFIEVVGIVSSNPNLKSKKAIIPHMSEKLQNSADSIFIQMSTKLRTKANTSNCQTTFIGLVHLMVGYKKTWQESQKVKRISFQCMKPQTPEFLQNLGSFSNPEEFVNATLTAMFSNCPASDDEQKEIRKIIDVALTLLKKNNNVKIDDVFAEKQYGEDFNPAYMRMNFYRYLEKFAGKYNLEPFNVYDFLKSMMSLVELNLIQ